MSYRAIAFILGMMEAHVVGEDLPKKKYHPNPLTKEQVAVCRRITLQMYRDGSSAREIAAFIKKGSPGDPQKGILRVFPMAITKKRVAKFIEDIQQEWQRESDKGAVGGGKQGQIRRLFRLLERAKLAGDLAAQTGVEKEIAKLQGNYAPVRVQAEVVITAALREVIMNMTPEEVVAEMDAALAEEKELKALREAVVVEVASEPANESVTKPIFRKQLKA